MYVWWWVGMLLGNGGGLQVCACVALLQYGISLTIETLLIVTSAMTSLMECSPKDVVLNHE